MPKNPSATASQSATLSDAALQTVQAVLSAVGLQPAALLPVLHDIQHALATCPMRQCR